MNIQELNKLNINNYELEYAYSDTDIMFLIKVPEEDVISFIEDDSAELFMNITENGDLHIFIDILNVKNKCRVGLEIPSSIKDSDEINNIFNIFKEKNSVNFVFFSKSNLHTKKLNIFSNEIEVMDAWINNKRIDLESQYSFKNNYSSIPKGYLIPQKTATLFWFVCKVTNDNLNIVKENIDNITLKADTFEGELVLYLSQDTNLIASIQLADDIIDESIREDFKLLLKQTSVSVLLNTNDAPDSNIANISLELDDVSRERIKYYMTI